MLKLLETLKALEDTKKIACAPIHRSDREILNNLQQPQTAAGFYPISRNYLHFRYVDKFFVKKDGRISKFLIGHITPKEHLEILRQLKQIDEARIIGQTYKFIKFWETAAFRFFPEINTTLYDVVTKGLPTQLPYYVNYKKRNLLLIHRDNLSKCTYHFFQHYEKKAASNRFAANAGVVPALPLLCGVRHAREFFTNLAKKNPISSRLPLISALGVDIYRFPEEIRACCRENLFQTLYSHAFEQNRSISPEAHEFIIGLICLLNDDIEIFKTTPHLYSMLCATTRMVKHRYTSDYQKLCKNAAKERLLKHVADKTQTIV